ncbi:hypothetical protein PILCRDRAFT_657021 [Piloderma croceum F 1598]|uniref:Uncharacterized protein n=1 Tax=Piloderma croceum (strain F 1598) TaxID=765440 RepID=A0A0C3F819_PILCF|nr:hypothetical protein PILCRDRAFT_657021 [Piloderma croceum F 1598]
MVDANIYRFLLFPYAMAQTRPSRAGTPRTPPFCLEYATCYPIVTLSGSPLLPLVKVRPDQSVMHIIVFCYAFRRHFHAVYVGAGPSRNTPTSFSCPRYYMLCLFCFVIFWPLLILDCEQSIGRKCCPRSIEYLFLSGPVVMCKT